MTDPNDQNSPTAEPPAGDPPASDPPPADPPADKPPADTDPPEGDPAPGAAANAEAKRYRTRLRATEAERDEMRAQIDALQVREVERLATAANVTPAALFAYAELSDMTADDGTVDVGKVAATIEAMTTAFGIAPPGAGRRWPDTGQGQRGAAVERTSASWGEKIRAARERR